MYVVGYCFFVIVGGGIVFFVRVFVWVLVLEVCVHVMYVFLLLCIVWGLLVIVRFIV